MNILILEDDQECIYWFAKNCFSHKITLAETASEAISALKCQEFDMIFLDHDLNNDHYAHYICSLTNDAKWDESKYDGDSGFCVAKFLRENPQLSNGSQIIIHTMHPRAQKRMFEVLTSTAYELQGRNVKVIPFETLRKTKW